jgi:hypothetical protein
VSCVVLSSAYPSISQPSRTEIPVLTGEPEEGPWSGQLPPPTALAGFEAELAELAGSACSILC